MEKLASTEEPIGEQHVKAFLLGAGLEEDSRLRRAIMRLVRALNRGLFDTEDGALGLLLRKHRDRVRTLVERLSAGDGDGDQNIDGRETASTGGPGPQNQERDANEPRLKLVEMVVIMQQLCTSVRILRSASTHFTRLVVSGQFQQVISELEHCSIASEAAVSLDQMREEIANVLVAKIDLEDKKLKRDALEHYINQWAEMQYARADKRKKEREQREGAEGDADGGAAKVDEEVDAMVEEKVEKMRADWRAARLELLAQAGLGPAFQWALLRAVSRRTNQNKSSKQQPAAAGPDPHSKDLHSQREPPSNEIVVGDSQHQQQQHPQQQQQQITANVGTAPEERHVRRSEPLSRRVGRVNAIVKFLAGAIDRTELERERLDDDIDPTEWQALHDCILAQVCRCVQTTVE